MNWSEEWGTPAPSAKEPIKRLEPLELPLVDLSKWKTENPWYRFLHSPDGAEMAFKLGLTVAVDVLSHTVKVLGPASWIHLAYKLALSSARDDDAREAQLEAWDNHMWHTFWANDSAYPSASLREAEFDRLAGDDTSHGIVPALTQEAEARKQELIHQANQRWLANAEAMGQAQKDLEHWEPKAKAEHAELLARAAEARKNAELYALTDPARAEREQRWAEWAENAVKQETTEEDVYVHRAREIMDSYKADVRAVVELETNPANWDLTPEQRGMLHNLQSEMPDVPAAAGDGAQATGADVDGADAIYDVIGGRPE